MVIGRATRTVQPQREPVLQNLTGYIHFLNEHRVILILMCLASITEVLGFTHMTLLPVFAKEVLNVGPAGLGYLTAVRQAGGHRLTETGLSLGTPHYMSPEQAMGDRELDARSDVYSLGAMLYEMLVGEPPFTGPTAQAIVAKVLTEKPPLVTAARDTVPPHVASAVSGALAKLPADRFASAAAFANALTDPGLATSLPGVAGALAPKRAAPRRFA